MIPENICVASHGTVGARAAEELALKLTGNRKCRIHQLFVVPDFWKGMMGDDWLNNAVTRARFGQYVEDQLAREAADEVARFEKAACDTGAEFSFTVAFGKPAQILIEVCGQENFDSVVIGSPRPKYVDGYSSRMKLDDLARGLKSPLLIAPFPDQ